MDWAIGFFVGLTCGCWIAGKLPRLLLLCHDHAFRLWWRWRSRHRGGRPPLDPQLIALIRRISLENPLWGAPPIHGELLKLGFQLSQSSVSKYMAPRDGRPAQTWTTFLRNHADEIVAIDMLTVRSLAFECLYAFIVLSHGRRQILHVEVTDQPTALWLAAEIGRAFARVPPPAFLVRDGLYGGAFQEQVRLLGLDDRPTRPRSPWQNHVERLIGSIRRECLDHCIIWNAAHLRRVLQDYADYYNNDRTHLALAKDAPHSRSVEPRGRIASRTVLGGLHRRYYRMPEK